MQKKIKIKRVGEVSDYIERLYVESFPADERRPLDEWRRLIGEGRTQLYEVMADGETVGFITVWDLGDIAYGEHFAIDLAARRRYRRESFRRGGGCRDGRRKADAAGGRDARKQSGGREKNRFL